MKNKGLWIAIAAFLLLRQQPSAASSGAVSNTPLAAGGPFGGLNFPSIFPTANVPLSPDQTNALNQQAAQITADGGDVVYQQGPANVVVDEGGELATVNSTGGTTVLPDPNGIGGGFAT